MYILLTEIMQSDRKGAVNMNTETYNGYTNYLTWKAASWIDNDESSYNYWHGRAKEEDVSALAKELQQYFNETAPESGKEVFDNLLGFALSLVNWYEIAEAIIDDNKGV